MMISSIPKNATNNDAVAVVPEDHSRVYSRRSSSPKSGDDGSFTKKTTTNRISSVSSTSKPSSKTAKKATGSIHLTKPTRRTSLSVSLHSGPSIDQSGHSGYDSDQTEVTSNTIPTNYSSPRKSSNSTLSTGYETVRSTGGGTRWSSGDATQPAKRGSIELCAPDRRRRSSGSTASSTSCGSTLVNEVKLLREDNQQGDQEEPVTVQQEDKDKEGEAALVSVADCDLKSKPGVINIQEEGTDHLDDSDSFAEEPCHQSLTHSTGASATDSSGGSAASLFLLTEERVRTHMKDYYEDFDSIFRLGKSSEAVWDSFFKQYYTKEILWVRSSSNTLKGAKLAHHFANDIEGIRMQLVSVDNVQILGGMSAVVVFTADQEFLYRGHPVSDRTVLTMVLHVDASLGPGQERIRIAHEHRCAGKPIPKDTRWRS